MAKISRATQLLFGSIASANQMSEFGSFAAGVPQLYSGTTITPAIIQSLSNYLEGWFAAVDGEYAPAIEDMNAICYLFSYQLGYLLQTGVPEWDTSTTYYIGSVVQDGTGVQYVSTSNANVGNSPMATNGYLNWSPKILAPLSVYPSNLKNNITPGVSNLMTNSWAIRRTGLNNEADNWESVVYATAFKTLVAVGLGSVNRVMTSPDAVTWTARTPAAALGWISVCYSSPLTRLVAVALSGANGIMYSNNGGTTWLQVTGVASIAWSDVTWSTEKSLFVAVSSSTRTVGTSADGITWAIATTALPVGGTAQAVVWSKEKGLFVATGSGTAGIYKSVDGLVWTAATTVPSFSGGAYNEVTWSQSLLLFCTVGSGTTKIATSPDGDVWTAQTPAVNIALSSVDWSPRFGIFAAVSQTTGQAVQCSTDGINWYLKASDPLDGASWVDITWASDLNQFVAVAFSVGNNGCVMTSFYRDATLGLIQYKNLMTATGSQIAAKVAATYLFGSGDPLATAGTGTLYPVMLKTFSVGDIPAVDGLPARGRTTLTITTNGVAPTGTYTIGLYPITATAGGAGVLAYTVGTVLAGSTSTISAPALTSTTFTSSLDFDLPTSGTYALGLVQTGTVAASSLMHLTAGLDYRNQ